MSTQTAYLPIELNPSLTNGLTRECLTSFIPKGDIRYFSSCDLILVKNVIQNKVAVQCMAKELLSLKFDYSVNDLHSLAQTADFSELETLPPCLMQFVHLLSTQLRRIVEDVFDTKTKNKMTMTASMYNKGDYLLCHDDLCGDRHIAFVYYLSEDWTEDDGGALRFFPHSKMTSEPLHNHYKEVLLPTFNSLVFFQVSTTSHHEVQEVFSNKQRLSINGWFHCDALDAVNDINQSPLFQKTKLMEFKGYNPAPDPSLILQPKYLSSITRQGMSKRFDCNTLLWAEHFLNEDLYEVCVRELLTNDGLNWKINGPPNHRKYEVLDVFLSCNQIDISDNLPNIKLLLNFFVSEFWLAYLNQVTNLEFAVFDENHFPPVCMVEVQRWKEGSYSLLSDNDYLREVPTIEVTVFFKVDESLIGNEETGLYGHCNTSGNVIQTTKHTHPSNIYETLTHIKMQRIRADIMNNEIEKQKRICQKRRPSLNQNRKKYPKVSKATLSRIQCCVRDKIDKIKQYRLNSAKIQNQIVTPKSNSVLITMNSENSFKFISYIQKKSSGVEPMTCYYSITVTYVTTCSYDERPRKR